MTRRILPSPLSVREVRAAVRAMPDGADPLAEVALFRRHAAARQAHQD